ncbi:MAG: hypothetical protein GX033_02785 [Firmicutes bacterium]|nr:hypothetical protein [Bacillota bacterium]
MSYSEERELREAIQAGREVRYHLDGVSKALNSASNWGLWDMFGGGLFVTWAKHSRLNDAKQQIRKAQDACRTFARELRDVQMHLDINLEMDGFLKFADYFFDGFLADIMVQSRINSMRDDVNRQRAYIESTLWRLEDRLRQIRNNTQ